MLTPQFLDELRVRTTLSAVIAPSVKLTKAGREFKACCPFHQEKSPSFTVNDEKGFYHCFGCGAHGDAIRFLTDSRGMQFMDAVKELAGKAGMDVPAADPRSREKQEQSVGLHEIMAAAQAWFADQLAGIDGAAARDYLKGRGIDAAAVARFGIGFAPDSRGKLKTALAHFDEEKLVESGMLIRPDDDKDSVHPERRRGTYDRFRGRLMIPIRDPRGRVIAFGGRILGPGEPKYLNSPDTPLFDKGRTLYNLDLASPASRKAGRVIVVEGYMDVIGLDRAGIAEVVAPNGTALTEAQLERMWRLEPAPILCFDGDAAGQKASIRAAIRALPFLAPERTLSFVALPAGQDPDDVVRAGGKPAIEALLAAARPLVDHLWHHEVDSRLPDTPEARAGLRQRLVDYAAAIADANVRSLYRDEWLGRFNALVRPQQQQRGGGAFTPRTPWKKNKDGRFVPPPPPASHAAREIGAGGVSGPHVEALLNGFALFPKALLDHTGGLAGLPLMQGDQKKFRDILLDTTLELTAIDREQMLTTLSEAGLNSPTLKHDKQKGLRFSFVRSETEETEAISQLSAALEALRGLAECNAALDLAETRMKSEFTSEAFADQQRLLEVKRDINQRLASLAGND